jgi:hypothetical protein
METSVSPETRTRRLPFRLLLYGFALVFAVSAVIAYFDAPGSPILLSIVFATFALHACLQLTFWPIPHCLSGELGCLGSEHEFIGKKRPMNAKQPNPSLNRTPASGLSPARRSPVSLLR